MSYPTNGTLPIPSNFIYVPDVLFTEFNEKKFFPIGSAEYLFPHVPEITDISQSLDNCFFLSPLLSILSSGVKGQQFITSIMTRLPDGRILVKFFNYVSGIPVFILLDSTYFATEKIEVGHRALWVLFIEKAYAAYNLVFKKEEFEEKNFYFERMVNCGFEDDIFKLLGNINAEYREINSNNLINDPLITIFLSDSKRAFPLPTKVFNCYIEVFEKIYKDASYPYLFKSPSIFAKALNNQLSDKTKKSAHAVFSGKEVIRREFVIQFIEWHLSNLNASLKKLLINYAQKVFSGKRGTNQYTSDQLIEYERIRIALTNNHLVVIGSNMGKELKKGLVGQHVYSVINCAERGGVKYLIVINPWKLNVRQYHDKKSYFTRADKSKYSEVVLSASEAPAQINRENFFRHTDPILNSAKPIPANYWDTVLHEGMFELALEDYVKNFSVVTITAAPFEPFF